MRLREPLSGYQFAQGTVVVHSALLFGCLNTYFNVLNHDTLWFHFHVSVSEHSKRIFEQLVVAHIIVPISIHSKKELMKRDYHVFGKLVEIISVFQYHVAIFWAQYYQIHHRE